MSTHTLPARLRRATIASAFAFLAAILVGAVLAVPAHAVPAGNITGTVTDSDGAPLAGVDIWVLTEDDDGIWDYAGLSGSTDEDGRYDLPGLSAGTYRLQFEDFGGDHAPEFYNDRLTVESADDIVVAAGATVSGIDAELGLAGHVTGRVIKPSGAGLVDIEVVVLKQVGEEFQFVNLGYTDENGDYDLSLAPGTYRIGFSDYDGIYAAEVHDNVAEPTDGKDVTVVAGRVTALKTTMLGLATPNVWKSTARVTVDSSGRGTVNVSCTQACSGWAQVWSDVAGTKKSSAKKFTLAKAGWLPLGFTDLPYVDSTTARVRIAKTAPDEAPNPQFNKLELVRKVAAVNVWRSTAKVTVSAYNTGKVSVSCTQACSGWAQVWSDVAGTKKSSAKRFTLTKAGYVTLPFTDLPYVATKTARVRIAKTYPTDAPSPQFNPLELVKGPQNVVRTTARVKVSATGKATVNVSCTMVCEGYVQLWADTTGSKKSANVVRYKLAKAGWMPMKFEGLPRADVEWKARVAATTPATSVGATFNPLRLSR